jgi:hypothetical protein
MALRYSNTKRSDIAAGNVSDITHLDIRTGTQPAQNGAATGTLLGTVTGITWAVGTDAWVREVSGSTAGTAVATGTPGWGRFRNSAGDKFFDAAYGAEFTLVGGGDIVTGGSVALNSASITAAAGTG